jgi:hypothetical protein
MRQGDKTGQQQDASTEVFHLLIANFQLISGSAYRRQRFTRCLPLPNPMGN